MHLKLAFTRQLQRFFFGYTKMWLEFHAYSRKLTRSEQERVVRVYLFTRFKAVRVPRRLTIHISAATAVVLSVSGCGSFGGIGKDSTDPNGGFTEKPSNGPAGTTKFPPSAWGPEKAIASGQGKVMMVDKALGFCVIDFLFIAQMPPSEQRYFVYRGNQQVGEIITTAQTDETFLVADINKGDIREGDSVRPE